MRIVDREQDQFEVRVKKVALFVAGAVVAWALISCAIVHWVVFNGGIPKEWIK